MSSNKNGSIFIGWSEDPSLAEEVRDLLGLAGYDAKVGGRNNELIRHGVGTTVIEQMDSCCGAIMLFTARRQEIRDEKGEPAGTFSTLSPNMLFEFGYLVGTLRVNRVLLVYIDDACRLIPSDMEGMWDYRVSSEGVTKQQLAGDIVDRFLSAQKVSITENKMKLCSDISALKTIITRHMTNPIYYDTEMAQLVLIFCMSSYMFEDMDAAEELLRDLQRTCADDDHLRLATGICMEYCSICDSLESGEEPGSMYLPEKRYRRIRYALDSYVDEISGAIDGDDEFRSMCLMCAYNFLAFANLMYYTGSNACAGPEDEAYYTGCCRLSIENAEIFAEYDRDNNVEFAALIQGYMYRNLALFHTQHGEPDLAAEEYEHSTAARRMLYMFFKQRGLDKHMTGQVKMEYYLSLADNILLVDEASGRKAIRDLDNYIRETKELAYNRSLQDRHIESRLEEAKRML